MSALGRRDGTERVIVDKGRDPVAGGVYKGNFHAVIVLGGGTSLRRALDAGSAKSWYWGLNILAAVLVLPALALSAMGVYFVSADVAYLMVLVLMLFAAGAMFLSILLPDEG